MFKIMVKLFALLFIFKKKIYKKKMFGIILIVNFYIL